MSPYLHTKIMLKHWLWGIINNISRAIRLEIVNDSNSEANKKVIASHIPPGNIIITEVAGCYNWSNSHRSGYIHHVHNHGRGDFCAYIDSTSHIEQLWHNLKAIIKKIYYFIGKKFCIYF